MQSIFKILSNAKYIMVRIINLGDSQHRWRELAIRALLCLNNASKNMFDTWICLFKNAKTFQ